MKLLLNTFMAFCAVALFSIGVGAFLGVNPLTVGAVTTVLSMAMPSLPGVAFAGLNKEIWLPELMEGFYGDSSFLKQARDFSPFVDNDKLHMAEAGVNPNVLKNNTIYPIAMAERGDTPLELELNVYDTENTILRHAEKAELSYDKRASVLYGHRMALEMFAMQEAAHNYAPDVNGEFTPILTATGADNGSGVKRLKFEDVLALETAFDEAEIGSEGRVLLLNTQHKNDLRAQDIELYKQVFSENKLFGFQVFSLATKRMPRYNRTTGAKVAFGAAAAGTDTICSIAFHKDEVMRADGSVDMFYKEKDPELRADILGFQKRGLYLPIRGKGLGTIYSPAV